MWFCARCCSLQEYVSAVAADEVILELVGVTRRYPGVVALDRVNFDLRPGEVHALVGENGAGKSTLVNVVSGVIRPDEGELRLGGESLRFSGPVDARRRGIVAVHQEGELFSSLSVAENMALSVGLPAGRFGRVRWRQVFAEAEAAVGRLPERVDYRQPAGRMSIAHRYMTRLAAALSEQACVVLLDEPTSALTGPEVEWLFAQVEQLRQAGVGTIYISHRQEEIFRLADRVTVLRDGRRVLCEPIDRLTPERLIEAMVGRKPPSEQKRLGSARRLQAGGGKSSSVDAGGTSGAARLRIEGLTDRRGRFRDVDLVLHAGEVLGVYGLIGAGRTELAEAIYGLRSATGRIVLDGRTYRADSPEQAIAQGVAYLPEDRLRRGVCRGLSIRANLVLSSLKRWCVGPWVRAGAEAGAALEQMRMLDVRARDVEQRVEQLSGGNQQKVVLGRCLLAQPKVLLLDEPTRGVDVGAKAEIHALLRRLADDGCAVMLISSDLPEVLEHSDRLVVIREGRIAGQFDPRSTTAEQVAAAALPVEAPDLPPPRGLRRWLGRWGGWGSDWGLLCAVLLLGAWLALTNEQFVTAENLRGVASGAAIWIVLALAAAVVIVPGAIDISIGSLLALAAAAAGLLLRDSTTPAIDIPLAVGAALAIGVAGGALNAGVALWGRIHPIVVTLGTMTVFRGMLILLTGGETITGMPSAWTRLATARPAGVPGLVVACAGVCLIVHGWLRHTVRGRELYAYGASPTAARLVGIGRWRVWLTAFAAAGALVGTAALMELARAGSMQSVLGSGYELRAIAAAVIGGTAITGGRGSVVGVVLGALLLSLLYNALVLWQVSRYHYDLVIGSLLLVAILLDRAFGKSES